MTQTPISRNISEIYDAAADAMRINRALENKDAVRGFTETIHKAGSWKRQRRVVPRIEATRLGLDIRFAVTGLDIGTPQWFYENLYPGQCGIS